MTQPSRTRHEVHVPLGDIAIDGRAARITMIRVAAGRVLNVRVNLQDGTFVGGMQVENRVEDQRNGTLWIATMGVKAPFRRKGVATAMAEALLSAFPDRELMLPSPDCGNTAAGDAWCAAWQRRGSGLEDAED